MDPRSGDQIPYRQATRNKEVAKKYGVVDDQLDHVRVEQHGFEFMDVLNELLAGVHFRNVR